MPVQFDYTGIIRKLDKTAIPDQIVSEWQETLLAEKDRIYANLTAQISNETEFINKIAEPSSEAYESFVNPNHPKAQEAILKQKLKLRGAYSDWNNSVQAAFASGGAFENGVNTKKDKWRNVRFALGAVGEKSLLGYGAVVKAVGLMTGDSKIDAYMGADDTLTGSPYNVFLSEFARYVKPMLIAKGVFAANYAFLADEAGDNTTRDNILNAVNTDFDTILNAFKRTDVTFVQLTLEMSYDDVNDYITVHAVAETS